jgi:hypothetical protein
MIEMSEKEKMTLRQCSLERVLNNARHIAERGLNSKNADLSERCGILIDDLEAMTALASRLWDAERNALFLVMMGDS